MKHDCANETAPIENECDGIVAEETESTADMIEDIATNETVDAETEDSDDTDMQSDSMDIFTHPLAPIALGYSNANGEVNYIFRDRHSGRIHSITIKGIIGAKYLSFIDPEIESITATMKKSEIVKMFTTACHEVGHFAPEDMMQPGLYHGTEGDIILNDGRSIKRYSEGNDLHLREVEVSSIAKYQD